jgi:hypothetical protein
MGIGRFAVRIAAGIVGSWCASRGWALAHPYEPPHDSINLWSVVVGGSRVVTDVWLVVIDHADDADRG